MTYLEMPAVVLDEFSRPDARNQLYGGVSLTLGTFQSCRRNFHGVDGPHEDRCGQTRASNLTLARIGGTDLGQDYRFGLRMASGQGAVVVEWRHSRSLKRISAGENRFNRFTAFSLGYQWRRPVPKS